VLTDGGKPPVAGYSEDGQTIYIDSTCRLTLGQGEDVAKLQRSAKFGRAILFGSVGSWRNRRNLGASAFPFVGTTNSPVFGKNGWVNSKLTVLLMPPRDSDIRISPESP